jgi:hypothetical protein
MGFELRGIFVNPAFETAELVKIIVRRGINLRRNGPIQSETIIALRGIKVRTWGKFLSADAGGVLGRTAADGKLPAKPKANNPAALSNRRR